MVPTPSPVDYRRDTAVSQSRRAFLAGLGGAAVTGLAGCSALASDPEPFNDGDWLAFGNGPANTNRVAGGAPAVSDPTVLTTSDWPYAPPLVHGGTIYFGSDRRVVALSTDGTERWSRTLDVTVSGTPALDTSRGRLHVPSRVVPTTDGPDPAPASVTTLAASDGTVVDRTRVGTGRTYGVTVAGGDLYVRGATACVRLGPDGTERWRRSLTPLVYDEYNLGDGTATQVPPAVTDDGVYVPDRDALVKLDRKAGRERWRVPVDTPYAAPAVAGDSVVQTGWQETAAVTPGGEVRWRRPVQSRAAAAAGGGTVYVAAGDLHALDPATGETAWHTRLPSSGTAAPVVTDDAVVVVNGGVRAYRRETGGLLGSDRTRWRADAVHTTEYCSPVVAAGRVFAVGPRGLLALTPDENS